MSTNWKVGDSRSFDHVFTQEDVERFAALTGDLNPVHMDESYARQTPAGEPVVHGMLAASFVSTLVGMHIPGPGAIWVSFQVDWRKMIRVNDKMHFEATIEQISESTQTISLKVTGKHAKTNELYFEGKGKVLMMELKKKDMTDPSGKKILVTGASGEIGSAVASSLAKAGFELILWGRNEKRLNELASKLGKNCAAKLAFDLSDEKAFQDALKKLSSQSDLYGFVHTAAPTIEYVSVGDAQNERTLADQWKFAVSAFHKISQILIPKFTSGGSIVHVLTQYVLEAPPAKISAYVSAKMAALGFVKSMAVELGEKGIRCNAVSPSMINSPFSMNVPARMKMIEANKSPLKRMCSAEDVANTVAFLCSSEANYINGVNLPITGGQ